MSPDPDPNDIPDDENVSGGPIADKGRVTAPMHGTDRPADGLGGTPGVSPDAIDAIVDAGGRRELDFEDGAMDTADGHRRRVGHRGRVRGSRPGHAPATRGSTPTRRPTWPTSLPGIA